MKDIETLDTVQSIRGTVNRISYRNDQNGYTVASVRSGRETSSPSALRCPVP